MRWLLEQTVLDVIKANSGYVPTASDVEAHSARCEPTAATSRIMAVAGDKAEVNVRGVLTNRPSFMAFLFGGGNVTYPEIRAALAEADANPEITEIILNIDSPGGTIDGLFDTIAAIENTQKPVTARVDNQAASAAFGLAAMADNIVAGNEASRFGSVGVVVSAYVDPREVSIASTKAPRKRPDVSTSEGKADIREELDALHDLFVGAIARGRSTTAEKVNEDFGRGGMLLAGEALSRGMIDSLSSHVETKPAAISGNKKVTSMDLNQLKAEHPATYEAAVGDGEKKERDRVSGHLEMAEASGAFDIATTAIKEGHDMNASYIGKYGAATLNRQAQAAAVSDDASVDTSAAASTAQNEATQKAQAEAATLARTAELCGVRLEA